MDLNLDRASPLPLNEQMAAQIRALIESGELRSGDPLPTIKTMAIELGVNPNTVAGVYRALEEEGYLTGRKRAGTRVAATPPRRPEALLANRMAAELVTRAGAAGLSGNDLLRAVAAQGALGNPARLRVAVLAADELQARRLAARSEAILGEAYECVPLTPERYDSIDYHLTIVEPRLTERLTPRPAHRPLPTHLKYGPEFPAGAD